MEKERHSHELYEQTIIFVPEVKEPHEETKKVAPQETSTLICSTCNIAFEDKSDFKSHYKSELHIENSKRKSKG